MKYCRKNWREWDSTSDLFVGFKEVYDSIRREVLYNTVTDFCISMKLIRVIKMCFNNT
jgi:hypothetical protein